MIFKIENIPKELREKNQWVCYRIKAEGEKTAKYMLNPKTFSFAKSNDSSTWSSFEEAKKVYERKSSRVDGLAFVLTEGYVFIDIDHSIDEEGRISDFTNTILDELKNTYAEKSCSGKGVHLICKGTLGDNYKKRNDSLGIEMYETKRFVCITGDVINERKEIIDYSDSIKEFNKKYLGAKQKIQEVIRKEASFSDKELISKIRESRQATKFNELYSGDISRYPSHSNADYAFVRLLAFWTQDKNQIDSIVRTSGLYREKWDKPIGNSTYGDVTINNALREFTKTYRVRSIEMM